MSPSPDPRADERAVLDHVHGLFRAYLSRDREAIRRGHCRDWRGFPVAADRLVRGVDAYMQYADDALARLDAVDYALLDTDLQVHGDLATLHYLARYVVREPDGGRRALLLRSLDVYRRDPDGWNQAGSNICLAPPRGALEASPGA